MTKIAHDIGYMLNAAERLRVSHILSSSGCAEAHAKEIRRLLFSKRIELANMGTDYYSLSLRIAYHFHRDPKLVSKQLSR